MRVPHPRGGPCRTSRNPPDRPRRRGTVRRDACASCCRRRCRRCTPTRPSRRASRVSRSRTSTRSWRRPVPASRAKQAPARRRATTHRARDTRASRAEDRGVGRSDPPDPRRPRRPRSNPRGRDRPFRLLPRRTPRSDGRRASGHVRPPDARARALRVASRARPALPRANRLGSGSRTSRVRSPPV